MYFYYSGGSITISLQFLSSLYLERLKIGTEVMT